MWKKTTTKSPENLCEKQKEWQAECKHIVPSGFTTTTWSYVKSTLESSRIIFSSGNTWKSDMTKVSLVATVPGSSQVNRGCVTTKERSVENSIRHGPFDIRGGGGGALGFFRKKISLLWFWLKKLILLNGTVKKIICLQ